VITSRDPTTLAQTSTQSKAQGSGGCMGPRFSLRAYCPDPLLAGTTSLAGRTLGAALPPGLLTDLFTWSASCSNLPYPGSTRRTPKIVPRIDAKSAF
jgi:hypothetical protein